MNRSQMASVTASADGLPKDCGATFICSQQTAKQNIYDAPHSQDRLSIPYYACTLHITNDITINTRDAQ